MTNYYVVKRGSRWASLREGANREASKESAPKTGGGEVRIQGRNGKFRDSDTIAPANDPCPPRDTKH